MLFGKIFIVFSDEWGRHPSSCEHIVKNILPNNRVIWVNTIGMRTPQFNLYDIKRSYEKILSWVKPSDKIDADLPENLKVLNPKMLPFNKFRLIRLLNRLSVERDVRKAVSENNSANPIVIASVTNVADFVASFDASAVVYYCVDDYVEWPGADKNLVMEMEEQLLKVSDLVLATADDLCQKKRRLSKIPQFLPHGVDFDHFNLNRRAVPPSSLIGRISPPIIGFFGAVSAWVDFDLLVNAANERPDWSFVLIGPIDTNVGKLNNISNIHLLGKVSYQELPYHAIFFDVGVIPFCVNELTISVNPLKLIEYLACGFPIVSTNLPEVRKFSKVAYIVDDKVTFVECISKALEEDDDNKKKLRKKTAKAYSWKAITEQFCYFIDQTIAKKNI